MARELGVLGLAGLLAGVPLWVMMCHCAPLHSAGYGRMADGIGQEPAVRRTACTPDFRWSSRFRREPGPRWVEQLPRPADQLARGLFQSVRSGDLILILMSLSPCRAISWKP